uniref:(+)-neomenthol dehydrogenase n=2 Tax=Physcomitrium patens TaxID=3218 RepID=A0A2K1L7H8_PHYPA|nr:hypothetical protein PHYPA_000434 [Physcomitrium patens]
MGSATVSDHGRWWSSETVAVVTGGNKGIGLEVVRRLALEGLTVILTAGDSGRGLKSTQFLHAQGLHNVVFQKLDVRRLDILVNNAAVFHNNCVFENAFETLKINYRGIVAVIEELLPLFRASHVGARIVNMSSFKQLNEPSQFDEYFLIELDRDFLEACRLGNGGPNRYSNTAYQFSKILINAHSRFLAIRLADEPDDHKIYVHNAHPGFLRTDMHRKLFHKLDDEMYQKQVTSGTFARDGVIEAEEGADTPVLLCLLSPDDCVPKFFAVLRCRVY